MHRTNIYLTTPQKKVLDAMAKKQGVSTSEMIRRVIDEHLAAKQKK
jgi:predicted DNA-binding ribbon-helix-helix protein